MKTSRIISENKQLFAKLPETTLKYKLGSLVLVFFSWKNVSVGFPKWIKLFILIWYYDITDFQNRKSNSEEDNTIEHLLQGGEKLSH